jgi:NLI interacting factor-like phosphatase
MKKNAAIVDAKSEPRAAERPIVIVDMDGTLADVNHRLHHINGPGRKNWPAFFELMDQDPPNGEVVDMVREYAKDHEILIVTGRPDSYRQRTIDWLHRYGVPFSGIYMRKERDRRPDHVVKKEILDSLGPRKARVALVIDDRPSVCDMWRACGLKVHQIM